MNKRAISIIGTGMGSASWLEHPALAHAEAVVGGRRLLERLTRQPARKILLGGDVSAALDAAGEALADGLNVAVLATGDPLFFGIGAAFAKRFGVENLRVFPAVSAMQEAAARLALPWDAVAAVSLHGRNSMLPLAHALISGGPVCVLTDAVHSPARVAAYMGKRGRTNYAAAVFSNLATPAESVWRGTPEAMEGMSFPEPNVVFLLPDSAREAPRPLCPGQDESSFARENGPITKWPVRAAVLAALRIEPRHTVWDLGSGSGSVAVEAAALAYRGLVAAVEKESARVADIVENRRRFGAANLEIAHGDILSLLPSLPPPDRVFIGGGLGASREETGILLRAVWAALPSGGRLAAACVLLLSLENARSVLAALRCPPRITLLQAGSSSPLGNDVRILPGNPVFLLDAQKP